MFRLVGIRGSTSVCVDPAKLSSSIETDLINSTNIYSATNLHPEDTGVKKPSLITK